MSRTNRIRSALPPIALLAAVAACLGCRTSAPLVNFNPDGTLTAFKRYEPRLERDFLRKYDRKAYRSATETDFELARGSQETILEIHGEPDYVRERFRSIEGELVDEWVYLDHRAVYQFVSGDLVHEGPFTDFEQLLLRFGRPDRYALTVSESGLVRHVFEYGTVFTADRGDIYSLADDWIVSTIEGN